MVLKYTQIQFFFFFVHSQASKLMWTATSLSITSPTPPRHTWTSNKKLEYQPSITLGVWGGGQNQPCRVNFRVHLGSMKVHEGSLNFGEVQQ